MNLSNLSQIVKQKMKEKNLKVADLARLTDCSVPYCYDLLRGRRRWNEDTMSRFAEALGIEIVIKAEERQCEGL